MKLIVKATALNDGKDTLYEKALCQYVSVEVNGEIVILKNGETRQIEVLNTALESTDNFNDFIEVLSKVNGARLSDYLANATYIKPMIIAQELGVPLDTVRSILHKGQMLGLFRSTARGFRVVPERQNLLKSLILKKKEIA